MAKYRKIQEVLLIMNFMHDILPYGKGLRSDQPYLDYSRCQKPQKETALCSVIWFCWMTWDDEEHPSVEVPLGRLLLLWFWEKECTVNSYSIAVVPARGMNSYFSMPFTKGGKIELINEHKNPIPAFFLSD